MKIQGRVPQQAQHSTAGQSNMRPLQSYTQWGKPDECSSWTVELRTTSVRTHANFLDDLNLQGRPGWRYPSFMALLRCAGAECAQSPPPLHRAGQGSAVYKDTVLVFGGRTKDAFFNDLWGYDPARGEWACLSERAPFPARANHSCTVAGHGLWVIGGSNATEVFGDVHVFDLKARTWTSPSLRGPAQLLQRTAHGACAHPLRPDTILIHGGYGTPEARPPLQWLSDLVALNTLLQEVRAVETGGSAPEARGYHAFAAVGERAVAIGGRTHHNKLCQESEIVGVFDLRAQKWLAQPLPGGIKCMGPRSSLRAVPVGTDCLLCFGGSSASGRLNDFHLLRVDPSSGRVTVQDWGEAVSAAVGQGQLPTARAAHCMEATVGAVFIIGGYAGSGKSYCADMWRVDIALDEPVIPARERDACVRSGQGEASQWRSARRGKSSAAVEVIGGATKRQKTGKSPDRGAGPSFPVGRSPARGAAPAAAAAALPRQQPQLQPQPAAAPGCLQPTRTPVVAAAAAEEAAANAARTARLEQEVRQLRAAVEERKEADAAAAKHTEEQSRVQNEVALAEKGRREAERERDEMRRALEEERESSRAALARVRQEGQEELQRQLAAVAREREALAGALREKDHVIGQLEGQMEDMRAKSRRERVEWDASTLERQRHIEQLTLDLDINRKTVGSLNKHISAKEQLATRLQAALDEEQRAHAATRWAAGEERDKLVAALQAEKEAGEAARAQGEALRTRVAAAEEAARAAQAEAANLRSSLAAAEERAGKAEADATRLQQEVARLRSENARVADTVASQRGVWEQQMRVVERALEMAKAAAGQVFGLPPG